MADDDRLRVLVEAGDVEAALLYIRDLARRGALWAEGPFETPRRIDRPPRACSIEDGGIRIGRARVLPEAEAHRLTAKREGAIRRIREQQEEEQRRERRRWGALSLEQRLADLNGQRRTRVLAAAEVLDEVLALADQPIGTVVIVEPSGLVSSPKAYRRATYRPAIATLALLARIPRWIAGDATLGSETGRLPAPLAALGENPVCAAKWAAAPERLRWSVRRLNSGGRDDDR